MKNSTLIVVIAIIVIGGFLLFNRSDTEETVVLESQEGEAQVEANLMTSSLLEQNESEESGLATLGDVDGMVVVNLDLDGAPEFAQPAHIHSGSCSDLGGVVYPLTSPENGVSETTLEIGTDELLI